MAKVLLENTTQSEIRLQLAAKDGVQTAIIPAARENASNRKKIDNGFAEVDDSFLKEAMKKPVVKAYFEEGMLKKAKKGANVPAAAQPETPPADDGEKLVDEGATDFSGGKTPAAAK